MKSHPPLVVHQLSKKFRLYRYKSSSIQDILLMKRSQYDELYALKKVSFDLQPGEVIGIIGRNGSGKSTLLRILARIYQPTEGTVEVRGRLSALIELGAGFHPELTGRENVYLYASFLGMDRKEINKRMPAILSFSEMGDFIDAPIKSYSMGMFLRLAFSTALQVDPDILVIDEIIGVGDVAFQEKSIARILQLKDAGKTIAVVSHHMTLIRYLSTKVLWLEKGEVKGFGPPSEVIGAYLDHLKVTAIGKEEIRGPGGATINRRRWGEGKLVLDQVSLIGEDGKEKFLFAPGEKMRIRCHIHAKEPVKGLGIMLQIHLQDGSPFDGPRIFVHEKEFDGEGFVDFVFDALPFVRSTFMLSVGLYDRENAAVPCDYHERLYEFSVLDQGDTEALGFLKLPGRWEANLGG